MKCLATPLCTSLNIPKPAGLLVLFEEGAFMILPLSLGTTGDLYCIFAFFCVGLFVFGFRYPLYLVFFFFTPYTLLLTLFFAFKKITSK